MRFLSNWIQALTCMNSDANDRGYPRDEGTQLARENIVVPKGCPSARTYEANNDEANRQCQDSTYSLAIPGDQHGDDDGVLSRLQGAWAHCSKTAC